MGLNPDYLLVVTLDKLFNLFIPLHTTFFFPFVKREMFSGLFSGLNRSMYSKGISIVHRIQDSYTQQIKIIIFIIIFLEII